jgi:peptidoglycan DL-endopeptidase CwlO
MHARHDFVSKSLGIFLALATVLAAWPAEAHAVERPTRASVEPTETKAPKKTKRKRHAHEGHPRAHSGWATREWLPQTNRPHRTRTEIVVETARETLGKPYRWAGTGPATFDCSGLTRFVWAEAGVDLPHNSGAQYAATRHVPLDELQPGDLVFSRGHVGLYIGRGRMIHAPHSGARVEIAPLHPNAIGAGRPG